MIVAALLLLAPVFTALVMLVATGEVPAPAAVLAGLTAPVGGVLIVRQWQQTVGRLARHLVRWPDHADQAGALPAGLEFGPLAELGSAVERLLRVAREREKGLRDQLDANETVLEHLPDPLILIGAGRRVTRANAAARGLFGERMADRDLSATLRHPTVLQAVDAVLVGGASRTVDLVIPVPTERSYEVRIKPCRPPAGPVEAGRGRQDDGARVLVMLHDTTAVRRSEQMRADFVANASHELRTPLSTLIGFIETLRGPARGDVEAQGQFLAIMHEQASRMARLVQDLLSLSRIELDENVPPTGEVDMVDLLQTVIAALEMRAAGRRIQIRLEVPQDPQTLVGDEDQLFQVFSNLVTNAVSYAQEQSEVTVRLALADAAPIGGAVSNLARPAGRPTDRGGAQKMVAISVTDRGEGIPRTHLPRLTERFYRVDPARSRAMGGTGLGLAIVKHIVNRHRGRLTIESEVGRGSIFTVYLPLPAQGRAAAMERRAGAA